MHVGVIARFDGAARVVRLELQQLVPLLEVTVPDEAANMAVKVLPGYSGTLKSTVLPGLIAAR